MNDKLKRILGSVVAVSLLALPCVATAQVDPGVPGPLEVSRAEYDYGDEVFFFEERADRPTEMRAVVWHPTDLSTGPFPLVVFLHGDRKSVV